MPDDIGHGATGGPEFPTTVVVTGAGLQRSVREWAMRQGWGGQRVRQEQAQGILVAAPGGSRGTLAIGHPGMPPPSVEASG